MYGLYLRRIGEDLRIRSGRIGGRLGSAAIRQQDVGIGGIRRVAPWSNQSEKYSRVMGVESFTIVLICIHVPVRSSRWAQRFASPGKQ